MRSHFEKKCDFSLKNIKPLLIKYADLFSHLQMANTFCGFRVVIGIWNH